MSSKPFLDKAHDLRVWWSDWKLGCSKMRNTTHYISGLLWSVEKEKQHGYGLRSPGLVKCHTPCAHVKRHI
jgi:hypothetical protein